MTNRPTNRPTPPSRAPRSGSPSTQAPQQTAGQPTEGRADSSEFFAQQAASQNQEVLIRKRKRSHSKRKKRIRVALVVLVVVALVGGGTAWGVMSTIKAGEGAIHEASQAEDIQTAENAVAYDEGKTVKYNGHTYALNENMVSICIIGFDRTAPAEVGEKAGQADAVMVMALDTKTGEATAIGLPRDSMVEVGEFVGSLTRCSCAWRTATATAGKPAASTPPPWPRAYCTTCPSPTTSHST